MIERYSLTKMRNLWTDETKFKHFLDVEIEVVRSFMNMGIVPIEDFNKIQKNATFDINRILELEATLKHDVIAFTRCVSESLGEEKKWIHYGLTSTDVVDTAMGITIRKANDIIYNDLLNLSNVLKSKAIKYINTPCMGRTHGMHAEITSFGLKWALWYDELNRDIERFKNARKNIEVGKISGAVGNFLTTTISLEDEVCKNLSLESAKISTQVLSRDRHSEYMMSLALIASTLEKIATEIRHLSRTEILEVSEPFTKGQKGSSAMPHKKNPITSENICGCARIMRSYVNVALENNILWHERDISHSSAERIMLADGTMLIDYMLTRYTNTLKDLVVFEDKMLNNIYITGGIIFSGNLLNVLITKGYTREKAYDIIQPLTFNTSKNFKEVLLNSELKKVLTNDDINYIFNIEKYLKSAKDIYIRLNIFEEEN